MPLETFNKQLAFVTLACSWHVPPGGKTETMGPHWRCLLSPPVVLPNGVVLDEAPTSQWYSNMRSGELQFRSRFCTFCHLLIHPL